MAVIDWNESGNIALYCDGKCEGCEVVCECHPEKCNY